MSLTGEARPTQQSARIASPSGTVCAHCHAALAEGQEWCLECGAARTLIHQPPGWRIPAAIVAAVVIVVLAAFAIALINLSDDANRSSQVQVGQTAAAPAPATPAPAAATPTTAAATPTTAAATHPTRR